MLLKQQWNVETINFNYPFRKQNGRSELAFCIAHTKQAHNFQSLVGYMEVYLRELLAVEFEKFEG